MGIWALLILPGLVQADLYYPHADTTGTWGTEIAVINTGDGSVTGTLRAYSNDGTQVDSMAVNLGSSRKKRDRRCRHLQQPQRHRLPGL